MKSVAAFALAVTLAGIASSAFAQESFEQSLPIPYFQRAGGAFACTTNRELLEWRQSLGDVSFDLPCMRFGPVFVGMMRDEVATLFVMPNLDGVTNGRDFEVFGLAIDDAGIATTYLVVTYHDSGRVGALQLTGQPWPDAWQFSGITLGSSEDAVRMQFGEPLQSSPSEEPGTVQWSYEPWLFSFEIADGRVTSVRVADY